MTELLSETKPMTEEQYKHIVALFFYAGRLEVKREKRGSMPASSTYESYLETCKYTRLKKAERR